MAAPLPVAAAGGWNQNSNISNATGHHPHHPSSNSNSHSNDNNSNHPHNIHHHASTSITNNYSNNNSNIIHTHMSMPAASEAEEFGVQTRTMGLKVHYTFDKEAKVHCLARCPHMLQIQTAILDDKTTIGLVDLRTCIHIITEGSPEITNQDCDYTIYAIDHSEPEAPLVGYGLLSWTIDSLLRGNPLGQPPKMVTGRVTKNVLGVFGGGSRETLEVRLKLSELAKPRRGVDHRPVDHALVDQTPTRPALTQATATAAPTAPMDTVMASPGHTEWASFLQSNPHIGQPVPQLGHPSGREPPSRPASPVVPQGPPLPPVERPDLIALPIEHREPPPEISRVAPTPVDHGTLLPGPAASSRPSSRASNRPSRRKPPTGRPRGRPRKKPAEGNTSGYEDGTEGEEPREEGPAKKRVKTTKVDKAETNPFSGVPESLRVAASNSSSLRNFRPIGTNPELTAASQGHELPRAPTPVPQGRFRGALGQGGNPSKMRQESKLSRPPSSSYSASFSEPRQPMSPSLDGRSPESSAPTPNYSEGSPLEIGSSPPVPRMTPFIRSSPPPSSPVLPPMPTTRLPYETGFSNHDLDSLLGEEQAQPHRIEEHESPPPPPARKEAKKINGVPVQVYQIQDGPAGQDLVHIRSYTTPHPSSSALVPPEVFPQSSLHPDATHPHQSRPPSKKKKPAAAKPHPAHPPPTPPTTDAPEVSATPGPSGLGLSIPAPGYEAICEPPVDPQLELECQQTSQTDIHTQARLEPEPLPDVQAITAQALEAAASEPTPQPPQIAAASTSFDLSQDPLLQLALSFGMREVRDVKEVREVREVSNVPNPTQPEPTPPPSEEPLSNVSREESAGREPEPELRPEPPAISRVGEAPREIRPKYHRPPNRSQSAGPLTLPMPAVPASEPSALSKAPVTAQEPPRPISVPSALRRSASTGPLVLPVPESAAANVILPPPSSAAPDSCSSGDSAMPPSSPGAPRSNKNIVKKHAIKQRLEQAITKGEMPPFCTNCGAIETPTWRKIWVQEKHGKPEEFELSEKPGKVTAVEVIQRGSEDEPTLHRLIKKSLAPLDDRRSWQEMLLCNPCGIWLSKSKSHRPPDRWDKDLSRLGQERRKRGTGRINPRPKKPRSKDDAAQAHPTSEGYLPTDGIEPVEPSSPPKLAQAQPINVDLTMAGTNDPSDIHTLDNGAASESKMDIDAASVAGSSHSRGDGTARSPIDIEFDEAVGRTKRLLFPTPRKDGHSKALSDVDINTVHTSESHQGGKDIAKEKPRTMGADQEQVLEDHDDDLEDLFRSPGLPRPSTPPPNAKSAAAPLKTPTRPTPSHRPITRSVSRSLRSLRSMRSPGHQASQQTPTRTPGASFFGPGSNNRRRTPRLNQGEFEDAIFNTPISRRIAQMLSEQTHFSLDHQDLDFTNVPSLEGQDGEAIDFNNLLSADGTALSSPAKQAAAIGFDYDGAVNFWPSWNLENGLDSKE